MKSFKEDITLIKFILIIAIYFIISGDLAFSEEPLLIIYGGEKGEKALYKLGIKGITITRENGIKNKVQIETELLLTRITRQVTKDEVTYRTKIESGTTRINNHIIVPPIVGRSFEIKMNRHGKIISVKGETGNIDFKQMEVTLPKKPIKIGDSWIHKIELAFPEKLDFKIKYSFIGYDTLNETKCAVIKTVLLPNSFAKSRGLSVNANGLIYFDYTHGRIYKSIMTSYIKIYEPNSSQSSAKPRLKQSIWVMQILECIL